MPHAKHSIFIKNEIHICFWVFNMFFFSWNEGERREERKSTWIDKELSYFRALWIIYHKPRNVHIQLEKVTIFFFARQLLRGCQSIVHEKYSIFLQAWSHVQLFCIFLCFIMFLLFLWNWTFKEKGEVELSTHVCVLMMMDGSIYVHSFLFSSCL